ncbi:MAG: hypothetical protein ACSLE9_05375 [Burkholderiaceae bacterium]
MPRPDPTIDLTDAEKRDLIALIQAGRPLPEKYRFILFEDKREVELVWNGKTRDVCTTVLPFQTLEHVDEPRPETRTSPQAELFDPRGRQLRGWTNKLILSSLKSGPLREPIEEAGGLKLICIDPPFDVGADFSMDMAIGGEAFHKEPNILEQIAYRDTRGARRGFVYRDDLRAADPDAEFAGGGWVDLCALRLAGELLHSRCDGRGFRAQSLHQRNCREARLYREGGRTPAGPLPGGGEGDRHLRQRHDDAAAGERGLKR